ncbi:MAG: hypothetical protein IT340_13930, partial [Chloroflexi bacterium]|nr:hypothetical protein [Chloroflexota bacterium]
GYLANPAARATSWQDLHGGTLRTPNDLVGMGWHYPWDRRPTATVDLALRLTVGERVYTTRDDWAALGLHSPYHSVYRFVYAWSAADVAATARFLLADADTLIAVVALRNDAPFERRQRLEVLARAGREIGAPPVEPLAGGWRLLPGDPAASHALLPLPGDSPAGAPIRDNGEALLPAPAGMTARAAGLAWEIALAPGATVEVAVALRRESGPHPTPLPLREGGGEGALTLPDWQTAEAAALTADATFYAGAPRLGGDWPAHWRRGWVYDLETTRLCLRPAGGLFQDVWPAWMAHYPRVVVAEGTLDMLRLGYAAPALAQRAILTLFRDAPAANVPCVFEAGEPNMVAKDGSVCGTSPAWCLPFYNIEVLYRWTLDRAWLADLYPHLAAYLRWWLAHRVDDGGWVVYRCTWEAGEDNSPRLDPHQEGDHVITDYTRPVELQAMLAVSANVLRRLATELGDDGEAAHWQTVVADYTARTRTLWDDATGRFRDWDKRAGGFVQPAGQAVYWDADPARYSPLSLTPLLDGVATLEQARLLADELPAYDASPWCDWPSWTYAIVESAAAAGQHTVAARLAGRVVERVWRRVDRRDLHGYARPLPGVAPEYWPTDVLSYTGSDGYGWGATTLSLLLRQIIGLTESAVTDRWALCLTPGLPADLLLPGREYRLDNVTYRGRRFDLAYRVGPGGALTARLAFEAPVTLVVDDEPPGAAATVHTFPVANGRCAAIVAS